MENVITKQELLQNSYKNLLRWVLDRTDWERYIPILTKEGAEEIEIFKYWRCRDRFSFTYEGKEYDMNREEMEEFMFTLLF